MTVAQALAGARRRLAAAGVPSPDADARRIVLHALGWSAAQLVTRGDELLATAAADAIDALVGRRAEREPLQLILGSWTFRHVDLVLQPGVFVPRPETELLVDLALAPAPPGALILEPCTGSGAIAAALADERPDVRVVATDIDPAAVALARRNSARWADRVEVLEGDLLAPVDRSLQGRVDVLVANPPYLADGELATLEPEVVAADPHRALVAGPTGAEVTNDLVAAAVTWLTPGGWLIVEVDPSRAEETADRCTAAGLDAAEAVADLTGRARFVRARRLPSAGRV